MQSGTWINKYQFISGAVVVCSLKGMHCTYTCNYTNVVDLSEYFSNFAHVSLPCLCLLRWLSFYFFVVDLITTQLVSRNPVQKAAPVTLIVPFSCPSC